MRGQACRAVGYFSLTYLARLLMSYWAAKRFPDHLLGAARPAAISARIGNRNREIVAARVPSSQRARWATRPPVPASLASVRDVVDDAKLAAIGVVGRQLMLGVRLQFFRHGQPLHEAGHLQFCDPFQPAQVIHLSFQRVVGTVKPVALSRAAMHAQRPADSIAELIRLEPILARNEIYAVPAAHSLDRYTETLCLDVVGSAAVSCRS